MGENLKISNFFFGSPPKYLKFFSGPPLPPSDNKILFQVLIKKIVSYMLEISH